MSKPQKLTLLEKQFRDTFLRFVKPLQFNPNFWDLFYPPPSDELSQILEEEREYWKGEALKCLECEDPLEALKKAHPDYDEYWLHQDLSMCLGPYWTDHFSVTINPRQVLAWDMEDFQPTGLELIIHLHRTDEEIMSGLKRELDYFCLPEHKNTPEAVTAYIPEDWVLKVGRLSPCEMEEHPGPPECPGEELEIRVNLTAGKGKIKKAVYELLGNYQPRWIYRPERLQLDVWDTAYKIYDIKRLEKHLTFKEIGKRVEKSESRTQELYKAAFEHIWQVDYETGAVRRQDAGEDVPWIAYAGAPTIKDAERELSKPQGSGRRTPRLEEEESDEDSPFQSVLVGQLDRSLAGTAFEKLIKRICLKQLLKVDGYEQCGFEPRHSRCGGCDQSLEIRFRSSDHYHWCINPGFWKKIDFEIDGIAWNAYVESFTHAPIYNVMVPRYEEWHRDKRLFTLESKGYTPEQIAQKMKKWDRGIKTKNTKVQNVPKDSYISYRYQRIDEEATSFPHHTTYVYEGRSFKERPPRWVVIRDRCDTGIFCSDCLYHPTDRCPWGDGGGECFSVTSPASMPNLG